MPDDPKKPDSASPSPSGEGGGDGEHFDAIRAAEELAESIGLSSSENGADSYTATLETEIEQLNLLLDEKDAELARSNVAVERATEARDRAQDEIGRASARIERELAKRSEQKRRDMLLAFIEINDDLDRAIDTASTTDAAEKILEGVELVQRTFVRKLADFGVVPFNPKGEPFDPNLHDAVTTLATTDPEQNGRVIEVIRIGYTIGDECLRPASVAVGKLTS